MRMGNRRIDVRLISVHGKCMCGSLGNVPHDPIAEPARVVAMLFRGRCGPVRSLPVDMRNSSTVKTSLSGIWKVDECA